MLYIENIKIDTVMKNIIYTILIITLICCDSSTEKKVSESSESSELSESSQVLTAKEVSYQDKLYTLYFLIKENDFNKAGYALTKDVNDKYGNEKWEVATPTYIYEQSIVTELKKYNNVVDFYNSELGRFVRDQYQKCNYNSQIKNTMNYNTEAVCYIKGL
ncbi:hypothetical protein N9S88_00530 [bacterium]|nr:hypothetical protein [bacterium]